MTFKRRQTFSFLSSVSMLLWLLLSYIAQARVNIDGSCQGHPFLLQEDEKTIDTTMPLRVLRQNAPVYSNPWGNQQNTTLDFGAIVEALFISNGPQSGRVQVSHQSGLSEDALGWMDRQDLLCRINPLQNEQGLERKAFIKTPPKTVRIGGKRKKTESVVLAYPHYKDDSCEKVCNKLSRFEMYFIFAENKENQRYLLAENFNLLLGGLLMGWVEHKNIIPWNSALQIRPKEEEKHIKAYPDTNTEKGIEVSPKSPEIAPRSGIADFLSLENFESLSPESSTKSGITDLLNIENFDSFAITPTSGVEITGGKIWYKLPLHLPLLDIVVQNGQKFYQVAAPGIGMTGIIDVIEMEQRTNNLEALFKQVDVFFLLDGTRSMQPSLDAAKRFVESITNELPTKPAYRETHFRFGFRVYRDDFAGNYGIGKGLPLSGSCNARADRRNQEQFNRQIKEVHESNERNENDPTFEENLFVGLRQAVKDMTNCPNRLKLLFVIADHGDNTRPVPKNLIQKLTGTFDILPVIFFIQTPNQQPYNTYYQYAYDRFQKQGEEILQQVYSRVSSRVNPRDYFLTLTSNTSSAITEDLIKQVIRQVGNFSRSDTINEVLQKIRAGQSIESIMEEGLGEGNLPVLYWELLKKAACPKLGEQCQNSVDHRVITARIPVSNKIVEEIWISSQELDNWKNLLQSLSNIQPYLGFQAQKDEFIRILKKEIQDFLGKPLIQEGGTLGEQLLDRKKGLPINTKSPLMQYEPGEIKNMQQRCEFNRLIHWMTSIYDLLKRLTADPTAKVAYTLEEFNVPCLNMSTKGKNIKRLELEPPKPLCPVSELSSNKTECRDNGYRYNRNFRGKVIYTIPKDFLP